MWVDDVWKLFGLYTNSLVWQLLAVPLIFKYFGKLTDGGWALGRVLLTVAISLLMWSLANLGLGINTNDGLLVVVTLIAVISLLSWKKRLNDYLKLIREKWIFIGVEEILFLVGILAMGLVRSFGPELNNLEKYMDFGFIKQYLLADQLPVKDMWMAGENINYYSFTHYWLSIMIRWLQVEPEIGYNLMLALIFSLVLTLSFSAAINLLNNRYKKRLIVGGGLISAWLVCLGGNSHIVWFLFKNGGFWENGAPYWYAVATRFITNVNTEFPAYTFTIADLHPHLVDLPVVLAFLLITITISKFDIEKKLKNHYWIMIGLLMGVMVMANTWDALIYGLFIGVLQIFRVINNEVTLRSAFFGIAIVTVVGFVISATWWLSFTPIPQGIKLVDERSPLGQLLILWGVQWLIGLIAIFLFRRKPFIQTMVLLAFLLILIPEIVYVVDIYPKTPRFNTVFKLTYQSFVLFSLLGGVILIELIEKRIVWIAGLLAILLAILGTYPLTSYTNRYLGFGKYYGLNGVEWFKENAHDEYAMIQYLSNNRDGKNMIEYPGHSFSLSNSVGVFSGVPSVLGWREHEWLWRGKWEGVRDRIQDIYMFYPANLETKEKLIKKYNIGWIKVGKEERNNLVINDDTIKNLGEVVWQKDDSYLIKVRN